MKAGDLTKAKRIKKNLNCKPFQYFLEFVMPDMLERFRIDESTFAKGAIQSEADSALCIDAIDNQAATLEKCSKDLTKPDKNQAFELSWHRHIKKINTFYENCIDTHQTSLIPCHYGFGNQLWFYNLVSEYFDKI